MRRESTTVVEAGGDNGSETTKSGDSLEEELESKQSKDGPSFNPALYIQRYLLVADTVVELCDKAMEEDQKEFKILDLGCANCSLFVYLKNALTEKTISVTYIAVDKDKTTLAFDAKASVEPGIWDYTKQRSGPISVQVLEGNIMQPDPRLANADVLIMVEVVEHIPLDVVESSLPEVIFGHIRPRTALLTTPNYEFNVLFPDFQEGKCKFRHWDHRFEWTRNEFETWCNAAAEKYGYHVRFIGIGCPPPHRADVGCCTQMAHFTLTDASAEGTELSGAYETVLSFDYMWQKPPTPLERLAQNIRLALMYHARSAEQEVDSDYENGEWTEGEESTRQEQRPSFPINALSSFIEHMDEEKGLQLIRDIAVAAGFQLSEDHQRIICFSSEDEDDEDEATLAAGSTADDGESSKEAGSSDASAQKDLATAASCADDDFDDWNWTD